MWWKRSSPWLRTFLFFSPQSRTFFLYHLLANRLRSAYLGGVEPLRKFLRQKIRWGKRLLQKTSGQIKILVILQGHFSHGRLSIGIRNWDFLMFGLWSHPKITHLRKAPCFTIRHLYFKGGGGFQRTSSVLKCLLKAVARLHERVRKI